MARAMNDGKSVSDMAKPMRLAVLPLGRPTFDVEFARSKLRDMLNVLERGGFEICGSRELLLTDDDISRAVEDFLAQSPQAVVILQTTFTDASAIGTIAERTDVPILIWAAQEARSGGRLRLNAFCGLNLAAHALGLRQRQFKWIYADPENVTPQDIEACLTATGDPEEWPCTETQATEDGHRIANSLRGSVIGKIGEPPHGFDTCHYDQHQLRQMFEIDVESISLDELFATAHKVGQVERPKLTGLDNLNEDSLDRSCRLTPALKTQAEQRGWSAISIRCWPECFTEYGGAVCAPVSMLADEMLPCACESDVLGALSQLFVQRTAQAPVFLADLVDINITDDTAVVWHCGQAPLSMCDSDFTAKGTLHSNRQLPLLCEFPLKPGAVTLARISKAWGHYKLVLSSGQMLRRPLAFSGTAGVIKLNRPAADLLSAVLDGGLEHHFVVAYDDIRPQLKAVAASFSLPVMEI